jgi:hypothetical protein
MSARNMPGFTATRALFPAGAQRARFTERAAEGLITAAAEPGGPSTVPIGYNRECRRVPYTVCSGNRCWTEYGWICTYTPLPRMQ